MYKSYLSNFLETFEIMAKRKTRATSKAARKEGRIKPRKIIKNDDLGEDELPLNPKQQAEWDYKKKVIKAARFK